MVPWTLTNHSLTVNGEYESSLAEFWICITLSLDRIMVQLERNFCVLRFSMRKYSFKYIV